jgi:1-acyl-sn-glycerol-3-phosphate acyltransferase
VPVVPVAHNAGLYWKARSFSINSGEITVSYLPAIPPGLPDEEFMTRVREVIYAERDRLVGVTEDAA